MGDFKFCFVVNEDEGPGSDKITEQTPEHAVKPALRPAEEVQYADVPVQEQKNQRVLSISCGDVELFYLHAEDVESNIQQGQTEDNVDTSDIHKAVSSHSDLVPRVYEGGLKVWECSVDLIQYLNEKGAGCDAFSGKSVLELGCGAGLPGIYAKKMGAEVHFQDYNEEVLRLMTVPNVRLNASEEDAMDKDRFLAGDWSLVQKVLEEDAIRYDIILTAETIYSLESQPSLYNIIRAVLKPSGIVYIAAKTHYFGVGGGTRQFEDFVIEKGEFEIHTCKAITKGVQREILEMKFLDEATEPNT